MLGEDFFSWTPCSNFLLHALIEKYRKEQSVVGESFGIVLFGWDVRPVLVSYQVFIVGGKKVQVTGRLSRCPAGVMDVPCLAVPLFGHQFRFYQRNRLPCFR